MTKALLPSDVFVILPVENGSGIFAKNSHRPQDEVQEIIYVKGGQRDNNKLQCTYIEIDENEGPVNSIILSKPAWMWGAEMGANEKNVCICNVALRARYNEDDADASVKRLVGMDLVRLGLERGSSSEECLNVITNLIEKYGQGGPCTENESDVFYHNSFVIADAKDVWLLETCGKFWAAEKIESPFKYISNGYAINTKLDKMSEGLKEKVKALNLWNGENEFNFSKCFSSPDANDYNKEGEKLLREMFSNKTVATTDMFKVLRDKENNICHSANDTFPTQASHVSCLSDSVPSVHWFTGTPDPSISVYKPFVFTPNVRISQHTVSGVNDPKHLHLLYNLHSKQSSAQFPNILKLLQTMEDDCVNELADFLEKYTEGAATLQELDELMKDCVETEVKFYR